MSESQEHEKNQIVRVEIRCVAKGYQECPFVVNEGEEFVAQRKHGARGRAFKVTNARGQLGHLERVLVAPFWPIREELKWKLCEKVKLTGKVLSMAYAPPGVMGLGYVQQQFSDAEKLHASEDLERIALDEGFIISDNRGSGNCMFFALAKQLEIVKGVKISAEELRVNLVEFLKENSNLLIHPKSPPTTPRPEEPSQQEALLSPQFIETPITRVADQVSHPLSSAENPASLTPTLPSTFQEVPVNVTGGQFSPTVPTDLIASTVVQKRAFQAENHCCQRFIKRNNLSLRRKTTLALCLPDDYEERIVRFHRFIIHRCKEKGYPQYFIPNMDETPLMLDMPPNRTINNTGEKTVKIRTTGNEKNRVTVVLACCGDGPKFKPMVIFKRKTIPTIDNKHRVVVSAQKKGWMDSDQMKVWIISLY
ncbi:hypothetical protein ACROYT_G014675 [Oculina patagonica]